MVSIIILQNSASAANVNRLLSMISAASKAETLLIAPDMNDNVKAAQWISSLNGAAASHIKEASSRASADRLLFVDARADLSAEQIQALIERAEAESGRGAVSYAVETGGTTYEIFELGMDSIVQAVATQAVWPMIALSASKEIVLGLEQFDGLTAPLALAQIAVGTVAAGEQLSGSEMAIKTSTAASAMELSSQERASLLSFAVNSVNIEDLFPSHSWSEHEEESAAACYHTLAAIFIRLGDLEAARQCLSYGDQLEDSPRSLALKALISLSKGETLGAVANMVSSLQQYELRKKNKDATHYLTFTPKNLEVINTSLHAGLAALNKRDNKAALEHFATAVFNFDNFYSTYGVDSLQ